MTRVIVTFACLVGLEAAASAQAPHVSISSFDPENQTAPIDMVEGRGVKIGEGTSLYPIVGVQTGFASNVFFEEANTHAAGVLRLHGQIGAGSLSALRLVPAEASGTDATQNKGSFEYRAELRAAYDFMLSGNDAVQDTGGLGLGVTLRGMTNPTGRWSFGF